MFSDVRAITRGSSERAHRRCDLHRSRRHRRPERHGRALLIGLLTVGTCWSRAPRLAKTLTVKSVCEAVQAQFSRVQFQPPTCSPPTWWAPSSTTSRRGVYAKPGPIFAKHGCWPTRSTARPPSAERAARGDAGAAGNHRRHHVRPAPPLHGHGPRRTRSSRRGRYPLHQRSSRPLHAARPGGYPTRDESERSWSA